MEMDSGAILRLKDREIHRLKAARTRDAQRHKEASKKDKERWEKEIVGVKRGFQKEIKVLEEKVQWMQNLLDDRAIQHEKEVTRLKRHIEPKACKVRQ